MDKKVVRSVSSGRNSVPANKKNRGYFYLVFLSVIIIGLAAGSCKNSEPNWLRGNMHTHTFWSDGDEFPESVARWYKENGYDFLAMTDHNTILAGERWKNFPEDHATLHKYVEEYGTEWVEMHSHEEEGTQRVRLKTLEEFQSMYEEPGKFLLVMGNEISNPHSVHLLGFHQDRVIPAIQGTVNEREEMIRRTVENMKAYREETGINAHPALAHPNFRWAITAEMMLNVPELRFFEVFNGHPMVNNTGDESRASTDRIWDIVLANRLISGDGELLYGLATDDAHNYHGGGAGPGRGWVMVRSEELSPEAILDAIDKGDFYASTGVKLKDIQFNGKNLKIKIEPQEGIEFTTEFIGTQKGVDTTGKPTLDAEGNEIENTTMTYSGEIGKVLASSQSLTPSYRFTGDELYVRIRITSSADHIDPNTGKLLGKQRAWVQPHVQTN
ncbi:hypothetical protein D1164_05660 [Mariniphaga sediminis]|uniref:Polymerase/histidinol phosphatase N-terminal domain-containing protein n=1 Tax=Mariniphaga sediminis TaxID=1628158 RepID=A0A399D6P5_9BACT|nr:hypothetical protein [Mariniphaga sediminis]RIH66391.1 hypothetical protein D1164_05660 [Mariniphaga sediminis]